MKVSANSYTDTADNSSDSNDADEIEFGRIPNPPAEYSDLENEIEEAQDRFRRREIKLDQDILDDLQNELYLAVNDWSDSRSDLEQKLRDWNDLLEGVTPQTDFPWPGACSVHIPLPKIKAREIVSTINRSTMRPAPFLTTKYSGPSDLYEQSKNFTKDIENFLEDKLKNDTNIHETLKESLTPIYRDGTTPIQIMWDSVYEIVTDWKTYEAPEDFTTDYPSADDAGLSKAKYREIVNLLANKKKYEAQFEYLVPTYDGPRAFLVPLANFFNWPVWASSIKDMKIHGKEVWYTDYQLMAKVKMKFFTQDAVDAVIKSGFGEERSDDLTASRDAIEGISRGNRQKAKEYQIFELVYTGSLTKADQKSNTVRKYIVYYHQLSQCILRVEPYPVRKGKNGYFVLRFLKRDGRFLGISLLDDISDLSAEIDTIHRQRINARTITHVPTFKAKLTAKSAFDPSNKQYRFAPGRTFYLSDLNDVIQFDIRPVDLSGSTEDEMLLYQLIDMTTGSSSGLSGQGNPIDPRAPARKQQEMLRQSSNRIDDYVQNMLPTFEEIGQFVIDLYYQYGEDRIRYYTKDVDGNILQQEMERTKLFNPNVKFKVNGTSVFANPEMEYQRWVEMYQFLGQDPVTATNPRIRRAALERLLMSARVENENNFLPTVQELPKAFTTDEQAERDAKAALQKEKLATRLGDGAQRRDHELKMAIVQAEADAANVKNEAAAALQQSLVDAAVNAPPAQAPGQPAPTPMPMGVPGAA